MTRWSSSRPRRQLSCPQSCPCSQAERGFCPQIRPVGLRTCVPSCLQIASFDMSKTNSSRPGNAAPAVVHSGDVTIVAQLAQSAPIAPPQNLEAEESVLGAMLLSPGAIGAVSEVLDASDFYRESHAKIYRAGLALYAKGEPVD